MKGNLLHLEKWAEGRHFLTTLLSHTVVLGARDSFLLLEVARRQKDKFIERISTEEWLSFYERPADVWENAYGAAWFDRSEPVNFLKRSEAPMSRLEKRWGGLYGIASRDTFCAYMADAKSTIKRVMKNHYLSLRAELAEYRGKIEELDYNRLIDRPDMLFLLRVMWPCWMEYGKPASEIFTKAKEGDIDAIDDLFRLDPLTSNVPGIMGHMIACKRHGKMSLFSRLQNALSGTMHNIHSHTFQAIKYNLGALLYQTCHDLHAGLKTAFKELCKKNIFRKEVSRKLRKANLSCTDIYDLYNAAYRDINGLSTGTDIDFLDAENDPIAPKSFEFGIRRKKDFWLSTQKVAGFLGNL